MSPVPPGLDLTRFAVLGDADGWECRKCGGQLVFGPPPEPNAIVPDPMADQLRLLAESAEDHTRHCR